LAHIRQALRSGVGEAAKSRVLVTRRYREDQVSVFATIQIAKARGRGSARHANVDRVLDPGHVTRANCKHTGANISHLANRVLQVA